ncbi:MAG: hypothetical protein K5668_10275 [Lachnospiraceae bacterium]|nr:hypothetical protein [Lachnospiraceae bacterium]
MAVGKLFQNLGRSVTGGVNKAVLCIRAVNSLGQIRALDTKKKEPPPEVLTAIEDIKKVEDKLMKKAEASLKGKAVATYSDVADAAEGNGYIALEVQYNPTSLRLDTSAGRQYKYSGDASATQLQKHDAPSSTTLSFEILFDDTNNMDAFMLGDNPLTNASISNIKNTVSSVVKRKYSVQEQMDGLMSLLTIEQARHVIFFWGDLCFRGEVIQVNSTYTMFNKKGYPIRGKLGIQIRQGDGSDAAVGMEKKFNYDESYWIKAFEMTFTDKAGGASIFSKATNNSLLNLKL